MVLRIREFDPTCASPMSLTAPPPVRRSEDRDKMMEALGTAGWFILSVPQHTDIGGLDETGAETIARSSRRFDFGTAACARIVFDVWRFDFQISRETIDEIISSRPGAFS